VYYECPDHGKLLSWPFIETFEKAQLFASHLKNSILHPLISSGDQPITCPKCMKPMVITGLGDNSQIRVDQCVRCHEVWFDVEELEEAQGKGQLEAYFPHLQLTEINAVENNKIEWDSNRMDPGQKTTSILFYLGLPVDVDPEESSETPVGCYALVFVCVLTLVVLQKNPALLAQYAFDPRVPPYLQMRATLMSLFSHANWYHLAMNMYFLLLSGEKVERHFGTGMLMIIFFLSGLSGNFACYWMHQQIPSLGASGAIAGIMAFSVLQFPRDRLTIPFVVRFRLHLQTMPAWLFYGSYFLLEGALAYYQPMLPGGNNHVAHIGGAVMGVLIFLFGAMT
jgi:membrane associated rhomboid family serine protease